MTYGVELPDPRKPYDIRRIGGGDDLAVTLDDVKLDLRIDSDDEDATVVRLIKGMTDFFERRTGWRLSPAAYELLVQASPCPQITVERGPFRDLTGCWYWDSTDRQWVQIDLAEIQVIDRGREFDLLFSDAVFDAFPKSSLLPARGIRLQFEAGFDSPEVSDTTVAGPAEDGMILSLLALIAVGYESREAGGAAGNWSGSDPSKDYLLQQYRKFW